jgi:anti-sigma factor RsiW
MPDCTQISEMLSEYLDRDLPPDTCTAIDKHLASCATCAAAASELRETVGLCREYRAHDRPGPLPADKQRELRTAFEKVLEVLQKRRHS